MKQVLLAILIATCVSTSYGLERGEDDVLIRVVDVGAGLACVIVLPDDRYLIYDTGHWNTDNLVRNHVNELIPTGSEIELLVQSHSDSDHLGATDEICAEYRVKRILRTGMERDTATWSDADVSVEFEEDNEDAVDIDLSYFEYPPGATYRFGNTFVTMVFGTGRPLDEWTNDGLSLSEERNAVSIVIRLLFDGKSVLFCGDSVGRHIGDPDEVCIAAERVMVENSGVIPIDSDVIIAPHHGADNGSSTAFIEAVSPDFVIFSAGHDHEHPRGATAERYLAFGVELEKIFRTDRGDNEGDDEWTHLNSTESDGVGDDSIEILLKKGTPEPIVAYHDEE